MEMRNILIFAFLGAVLAMVITGGLLSMNDTEPSSGSLSVGALVGAALGSVASYTTGTKISEVPGAEPLLEAIGVTAQPDMKVGLPNF
jgi:hypothetical protein